MGRPHDWGRQAMKALFIEQTGQPTPAWNQIDWEQVERTVRQFQERVYRQGLSGMPGNWHVPF